MTEIGIGIVGGGYMGKAHAAAFSSVGALFGPRLRPRLEVVCATTNASAERYKAQYGFAHATTNWQDLVSDPNVGAVVIASPQSTHRDIAVAAFEAGKHVLCEKPMGASLEDSKAMLAAAKASGRVHMVGFNYIGTPASQFAYQLVQSGRLGEITYFRCEHTEDFFSDPSTPANWRSHGMANGTIGDLAPHIINAARRLIGPIASVNAVLETIHKTRGKDTVTNDDQAQMLLRFENGAHGHLFASRIATGRKMGYAYEIHGTKGAIRFDGEDQNALHLYLREGPEAEQGFRKILTGPAHPDYLPFCQGPGHGTGYLDQIIIEAAHFLDAIEKNTPKWPTFEEGLDVNKVVAAAIASSAKGAWVSVADI